jgi:plasmid stabilization system protein ParE
MKPEKNMDSDREVVWSAKAKITFYLVLDYLNENWTKKEIIQFNQRVQITINAIKKNPKIFPGSTKNKEIRRAIIDKNNMLFYKIGSTDQKIYLLTFFDCRQDLKKLIM